MIGALKLRCPADNARGRYHPQHSLTFRSFVPNYLLSLNFTSFSRANDQSDVKEEKSSICMNADYGTLEKVAEDFKGISKFNRSITYRKMTRGFTKIAGT